MILEIRNIEQSSFKIIVKLSDTVLDVKAKIKSKIEIEIDDLKLVYSGNILADNRTMDECDIDKDDYITFIYPSGQKKKVGEMIEKMRMESNYEVSENENVTSKNNNTKSLEASNGNTSTEEFISDDQKTHCSLADTECDELSCSSLLEAIPDVKSLCNIVVNDPVILPKYLSQLAHHRPMLFENILKNPHAFIDLLNTNDDGNVDCKIETVGAKEHEAIDRLVKKGYGKEMAKEVYRACNYDESGAAELLSYLY